METKKFRMELTKPIKAHGELIDHLMIGDLRLVRSTVLRLRSVRKVN